MTEAQILQRAKDDIQNFSDVYNLYIDRVYRYFMARTGDVLLSEDLTSQTFLKCVEKFDKYQITGAPFGAWLFRIARNTLIDHSRKAKHQCVLDEAPETDSGDDVVHDTHQKMLVEKVQKILLIFEEQEREIILLKLVTGLKFSEIAEMLNLNENTVKTKYFRNLQALKGKAAMLKIMVTILFVL